MQGEELESSLIDRFNNQVVGPMRANLDKSLTHESPEYYDFDVFVSKLGSEFNPQERTTIARYLVGAFAPDLTKERSLEEDIRATCLAWVIRDADSKTYVEAKKLGVVMASNPEWLAAKFWWYIVLRQIEDIDGDPGPVRQVRDAILKDKYSDGDIKDNLAVLDFYETRFPDTQFDLEAIRAMFTNTSKN